MLVKNRRLKASERRASILEATKRVCSKKGFSGARLDDIAKESKVSRALIIQHFGNKENLYRELIGYLFKSHPLESDERILKNIEKKDDFQVFYSLFSHMLEHAGGKGPESPLRLLLFSMLEMPEIYRSYYRERTSKSQKFLEDYIKKRVDEKAFKEVDASTVTFMIFSVFIQILLHHITMPDIFPREKAKKLARESIKVILESLKSENFDSYESLSRFHGHSCIGLAIGYRAAKIAKKSGFKRSKDEEVLAIVENSSCSVDAIQYMLGCTFGKGNLFFKDYGKQAFTIVDRRSGKAIRICLKPGILDFKNKKKDEVIKDLMELGDDQLFTVEKFAMKKDEMPDTARIAKTVTCEICGEPVMESRTSRINGKVCCIPCGSKLDTHEGGV